MISASEPAEEEATVTDGGAAGPPLLTPVRITLAPCDMAALPSPLPGPARGTGRDGMGWNGTGWMGRERDAHPVPGAQSGGHRE